MPIKTYKPTTPTRRHTTSVDYSSLSSSKPHKSLMKKLKSHSGRNNSGRITTRHQGGGHKKLYREIDFAQIKKNITSRVETIEYDPYRTAFIALVLDNDGARRYILAPDKLKVGDAIEIAEKTPLKIGNRLKIKNILPGYFVHNAEIVPNGGAKLFRSAGSYGEILGQEGEYTLI